MIKTASIISLILAFTHICYGQELQIRTLSHKVGDRIVFDGFEIDSSHYILYAKYIRFDKEIEIRRIGPNYYYSDNDSSRIISRPYVTDKISLYEYVKYLQSGHYSLVKTKHLSVHSYNITLYTSMLFFKKNKIEYIYIDTSRP